MSSMKGRKILAGIIGIAALGCLGTGLNPSLAGAVRR